MEVDLIFKIAAIGIIVAVINIILVQTKRDDQALMVTLAALVVVIALVAQQISNLFTMIKNLFGF